VLDFGSDIEDPHGYAKSDPKLVDTVGPSRSLQKLRKELGGVSTQAVHQRVGRGTLLALPTSDRNFVYPTFQFVRVNGKITVKRGLLKMFKHMQTIDPWQIAVLLNTPAAPELAGRTPVEWEKDGGEIQELERLALKCADEWERA